LSTALMASITHAYSFLFFLAASIRLLGDIAASSGELFGDYTGDLVKSIDTPNGNGGSVLNFILAAHSLSGGSPVPLFEHVSNLIKGRDLLPALYQFQAACVRVLGRRVRLRLTMDCAPQLLEAFCNCFNSETASEYKTRLWQDARQGAALIRSDKSGS